MGCRLTRSKTKGRDPSAHHQQQQRRQEELHFLDEFGQPITVQLERGGRKGRGHHRKRPSQYATERHWEALTMRMMEEEEPQREGYGNGPYCGHMTVSPDLYPNNGHMIRPSELYPANGYLPSMSPDHHPANRCLPGASYSLDHLDRMDYQGPETLPYQPNSESCLIGCCNTEGAEPNNFPTQAEYPSPWMSERPPVAYHIPYSNMSTGLGCGTSSSRHHHHQVALSEAETDAVSSLPGHTPSSPGSSPSSESLVSSEPSDSGFHSVSTGEFRRFQKIHSRHTHAPAPPLTLGGGGHSPREQRARWDLESIPEMTLMLPPMTPPPERPQSSRCIVGSGATATVQFHRAERSPTHQRPPPSQNTGCHTEPCQRRALWLQQQQQQQQQKGGGALEAPGRSQTMTNLSEGQRRRRASHPAHATELTHTHSPSNTRTRASYPSNHSLLPKTSHLSLERLGAQPSAERTSPGHHASAAPQQSNQGTQGSVGSSSRRQGEKCLVGGGGEWREDESLSNRSPASVASGSSGGGTAGMAGTLDWHRLQSLGGNRPGGNNNPNNPKVSSPGLLYATLQCGTAGAGGGGVTPPRSPTSPRGGANKPAMSSNQKLVRNQLLRARAHRLARERSEVTTDEGEELTRDEAGEWEGGKYWSRAERRRHATLSRLHKERRGGGGGEGEEPMGGGGAVGQGSSQMVLELSHRKQNLLRNSKLLDDWTTVEELLTHGTRVETDGRGLCPNLLLSVTTV